MFSFKRKVIDIIDIIGSINYNDGLTNTCSAQKITYNLRNILHETSDGNKRAVIFRINSPGGTAGAGEEIANMVNRLKEKNIMTVASIGDVGCSAAYLIASQCNYVFANRLSLVGSIGVIMAIPNIKDFSEALGIKINYFKSGNMKDIGNMFRDMTEEEKKYINYTLQQSHNVFIQMVQKCREIHNIDMLDGRFVTAEVALQNNLIDGYNDFTGALDFTLNKLNTTRDGAKINLYNKKAPLLTKLLNIKTFLNEFFVLQ